MGRLNGSLIFFSFFLVFSNKRGSHFPPWCMALNLISHRVLYSTIYWNRSESSTAYETTYADASSANGPLKTRVRLWKLCAERKTSNPAQISVDFHLHSTLPSLWARYGGLGKPIGLPLPAEAGNSHSLASPGLTWVERGLVRQS